MYAAPFLLFFKQDSDAKSPDKNVSCRFDLRIGVNTFAELLFAGVKEPLDFFPKTQYTYGR